MHIYIEERETYNEKMKINIPSIKTNNVERVLLLAEINDVSQAFFYAELSKWPLGTEILGEHTCIIYLVNINLILNHEMWS